VTLWTADIASETAFSSELWFRTTNATGVLLEIYSSGSRIGADRSTYLKDGSVCFYVYAPAYSELCTSTKTFNDGNWHSVEATLGPAGQRFYVDGEIAGSASGVTASAFNWDSGARLGFGYIGPNGTMTYFIGDIDEVRLWTIQRSAEDLAATRGRAIDPSLPGLQGYWKLDESGRSTTAVDSVALPHNGSLAGFPLGDSPWIAPGAF
jgi:hypothetical protein